MSSRSVTWIGYQLDLQSFRTFMQTLVGDKHRDLNNTIRLAGRYAGWKMKLPNKKYGKAPSICLRHSDTKPKVLTHLFFPVRCILYKSEEQPEGCVVNGPTEGDRMALERWIDYVNKSKVGENDTRVDLFEFAATRGPHPDKITSVVWDNLV